MKLENIVKNITSGGTPSTHNDKYYTGDIPWLRTQEVNFNFIKDTEIKITQEGFNNSSAKWIPKNSVIVAMYGNSAGRVAYNKIPLTTNQACCNITVDESKADSLFLYYYLVKNYPNLEKLANGGAQQNLNVGIIKDFPFPDIPLPEQHRISAILSSFDNKIELLRKENNTLEDIAQSIFKEWFVKYNFPNKDGKPYRDNNGKMIDSELGLIPEGWRVGKLGEIVEFSNGYAFKSEDLLGDEGSNCYKVFKMGNIKKGGGLNTNGKQEYIDRNKCETLTKYILRKGDLLMSMTDMKDNVSLLGNTALMNEDHRYIVNQRVGLIRPKNDIYIDFPYLYLLTNNDPFLTNLRKGANSGVQVNLSTQAIRDSLISIPKDKQILKNFDSLGKPLFEKIFNNEYNVKSLDQMKTALLNKLIKA